MPQNQQSVTAAASETKFTRLLDDASRIFVRHNTRITLLTSKQINGLQRNASETQESPDASWAPPTSNQEPATRNQQTPWTTRTLVAQNRRSARLHQPSVPRPAWLCAPAPTVENYRKLKRLVDHLKLHTVCESAACPNTENAGTGTPPS
jgi:hypothetical protein